ncbi:PH domain-like protein, partial [Linderina pennispora]
MRSPIENRFIRSGVLVRKHLFERSGKKASQRSWRTCYVSVDRGTVAMYKMDGRHGGHPDGRELTDTSLQLGSVSLRHTLTQMMPPPGYSRSRPHVFALQLPSGGVYLFQTASEVELRDWVAACNYWAARESKAPYMIGGVYNMEYGWD